MIEKNYLNNIGFQTFYISKTTPSNPLISEFLKLVSKFEKKEGFSKTNEILISFSYGKRVLINVNKNIIDNLKNDDFVEIVDYDPAKNNVLAIGKKEPCIETPVHWMIHNVRKDVNVIVHLYDEMLVEKIKNKYEFIEKNYPFSSLDMIKEVLKNLRTNNIVVLKNGSVLFCGKNSEDVEKLVFDSYEV